MVLSFFKKTIRKEQRNCTPGKRFFCYRIIRLREVDLTDSSGSIQTTLWIGEAKAFCHLHRVIAVKGATVSMYTNLHMYTLAIYAPTIYTALCIMFLMRADITMASGKGLCPVNREFFGACEMASIQHLWFIVPVHNVLMRADTLPGQVGRCCALEIASFLGPVKWHQANHQSCLASKAFTSLSLLPAVASFASDEFKKKTQNIRV